MNTHIARPTKTFYNQDDGHTYWARPASGTGRKEKYELWACPTLADGTPEFSNALAADDFDEPLSSEKSRQILDALTEVREIVWKDEGRDSEGRSFGPAYAEDVAGEIILNFAWITWKEANDVARRLKVELKEV